MSDVLTELQFRVVGIIGSRELTARDVHVALKAQGISRTRTAVYDVLARMKLSDLVNVKTVEDVEDGDTFVRKFFTVSGHGTAAYNATRLLYLEQDHGFDEGLVTS